MSITSCSCRPRAFSAVSTMPEGMTGVYQVGHPFQLSSTEIGVSLNIRYSGSKAIDLEVGNDLAILDDIEHPEKARIQIIDRAEYQVNPLTGKEMLLACYTNSYSFIPLGAKLANGKAHPHAGTGFTLTRKMGFPVKRLDRSDPFTEVEENEIYRAFELKQCVYDGREFKVISTELLQSDELLSGCHIGDTGLSSGIIDGEDLLTPISGEKNSIIRGSGFGRWRRLDGVWRLIDFKSVAHIPDKFNTISGHVSNFIESSLVRAKDNSLIYTAREVGDQPFASGPQEAERLKIWRSIDNGENWSEIFEIPHFHTLTPLTICRAADGTVFVAANSYCTKNSKGEVLPSIILRETLELWPIKEDWSGLGEKLVLRDTVNEFPSPPAGSFWRVDIPVGHLVRLADGKWHSIVAYRAQEHDECNSDAPLTQMTGCYIEEVYSSGTELPLWNF